MTIPVSVIIMTKNEEGVLARCLAALQDFDDVHVVDSGSADQTVSIASQTGAAITAFEWNGRYPKKKQWCLENLPLKHDWVLHVDADEEVTPELAEEIVLLFGSAAPRHHAGFFIKGYNVVNGKILRFGQHNNKLALLNRRKMAYPVVDDLAIAGGNEVEGHYQPVIKDPAISGTAIGSLRYGLHHHLYESGEGWQARHQRYAAWERDMNSAQAWPEDPVVWREKAKRFLRASRLRPYLVFCYGYIFKGGFLDGMAGLRFARDRFFYHRLILTADSLPRKAQ